MDTRLKTRRRLLLIGSSLAGGATLTWVRFAPPPSHGADLAAARYASFCMPQPKAARIDEAAVPDYSFATTVPLRNPDLPVLGDGTASQVPQMASVEYVVSTGRPGAVAVHGLSELVIMEPSETRSVRFRAIYTGRFPLHFHGEDGSHFEIAVLEIRPDAVS